MSSFTVTPAGGSGAGGGKATNGLRLTLTTATPVTITDVTGATTVYLTPYISDEIALYDGVASWTVRSTVEVSIALGTLTSGKNYDVFAYWTGTAVALELSAAWTSDTARSDAVAQQNGVYVKTADKTRRLVGTFRTTSTTQTEDSKAKRFLWNANNRVPRTLSVVEATSSWTYNSATFRQANGAATNQVEYVSGDAGLFLEADVAALSTGSANTSIVGIGIDSTSTDSATRRLALDNAAVGVTTSAKYVGAPGLGYHKVVWLESVNSGTGTFYGTNAARLNISGLVAMLQN